MLSETARTRALVSCAYLRERRQDLKAGGKVLARLWEGASAPFAPADGKELPVRFEFGRMHTVPAQPDPEFEIAECSMMAEAQ